jgi:hypothetical protein
MRWFRVRKADIQPGHRAGFEQLGVEIVRAYFTQEDGAIVYRDNEKAWPVWELRQPMKPWLREQYDRAERKETWSLTMEIAITVFVLAELVMSVLSYWHCH